MSHARYVAVAAGPVGCTARLRGGLGSVGQGRRRLERLEKEVAQARTAQAELQRRLNMFEQIAAAAGATLEDTALEDTALDDTAPLMPVPPTLLAVAQDPRRKDSPVRLAVGGDDVIAVIGDEDGDPREWWAAIHRVTSRLGNAS
jgi:hypothetical protein